MNAESLEQGINRRLQDYLAIPAEERGTKDAATGWTHYDRLVDDLAHMALDYAKRFMDSRLAAKRSRQTQVGMQKRR